MRLSIKIRLLLGMIGGMALLLALFALLVYGVMSRSLVGGFDGVLLSTARTLCGFIEQDREKVKIEVDEREAPEFSRPVRPDYFEVWLEDGTVLARSPSLQGADLDRFDGPLGSFVFRSERLPDGRAGRAVSLFFSPKVDDDLKDLFPSRKARLVAARETAALDSELAFLRWLLATATMGTILLALFVGGLVVRRGLRPLDSLAWRISGIRHNDLSVRIPDGWMPSEMAPVISKLNDLLCRLEAAFHRERTLTADVAHELRTPLAGMRSTLEVALARPRAENDYREAMSECLGIIRQTEGMMDSLLAMARLDGAQVPLQPETLRLGECIEDTWRPLADKARAGGISFESVVPPDLECTADRDSLLTTLAILLSNAAEYTNDGGRIALMATRAGAFVELSVANTGCRLSMRDVEHVFERFWRGDASRSGTGIHCGLGLALAQRLVTSLGGSIGASVADGAFTVSLTLPAASDSRRAKPR